MERERERGDRERGSEKEKERGIDAIDMDGIELANKDAYYVEL